MAGVSSIRMNPQEDLRAIFRVGFSWNREAFNRKDRKGLAKDAKKNDPRFDAFLRNLRGSSLQPLRLEATRPPCARPHPGCCGPNRSRRSQPLHLRPGHKRTLTRLRPQIRGEPGPARL